MLIDLLSIIFLVFRKSLANINKMPDMPDNMQASTDNEVLYEEIEDTFVKQERDVKSKIYATSCPAYGCSINKARADRRSNTEGNEELEFHTTICPAY